MRIEEVLAGFVPFGRTIAKKPDAKMPKRPARMK
jgi:hypothetical protein